MNTPSILRATLGTAAAASLLTFVAPSVASGALSEPVVINNVFSSPADREPSTPGYITIAFKNESDVAAKSVEFRVTDADGHETRFNDVGTFSPGAQIRHSFQIFGLGIEGAAEITEVRFADGSTWDNDSPRPVRSRPQARADAE